jgi:tRNA dimethylallyltransferase
MIIITGQTATGKTKLALALAKKHHGELINFDSRQIYKYLNIITGKDIPKNKIWLYDVVAPNKYFSSFDFVKQVEPIIKDIIKRGKTPILVGGTYLYIKHLLYGFEDSHSPPNFKLRDQLNDKSVTYLQKMLIKLNKKVFESLNHSDQLNPRRLIRRIEIEKSKPADASSSLISQMSLMSPIGPIRFIGIKYADKKKLRVVIEKRVAKRLEQGAIAEVEKLLKMGYTDKDPGLKTIGYQQLIKYLNKKMTKKQAIQDWINKEVQYAKRQLTFMKKDKNIEWREI